MVDAQARPWMQLRQNARLVDAGMAASKMLRPMLTPAAGVAASAKAITAT